MPITLACRALETPSRDVAVEIGPGDLTLERGLDLLGSQMTVVVVNQL